MAVIDLVTKLYEAYNSRDPAAVALLYATDATHEEVSQGTTRRGAEAIAEGLRRFFTLFPDAQWEPRSHIVDPDGRVAVTYLLTATLQTPLGAVPAAGQQLSIRGVHVLHLSGETIRCSEDYWDGATFHRQMKHIKTGETT